MAAASSSTSSVIGRDRSMSDAATAHNVVDDPRPPEAVHLPRSASYTYFPPVKDLEYEDSSVVELKGRISEADLRSSRDDDSPYSSSGGSTPENEPADSPDTKPAQPANPPPQQSRLSRFFSSSREPLTLAAQAKEEKKDKNNTRKESQKEPPKQLQKQPPKEVQKEPRKSSQKENSKQTSKPTPKQPQKEVPKQTERETAKEAPKAAPKQGSPEAPNAASKQASKESPKDNQQRAQSEKDKEKEKEKTDKQEADQQAVPPKRSLTHLRRKSWVPSISRDSEVPEPTKVSINAKLASTRPIFLHG
ncbi:hypothetical protein GTA08_BOTSDO05820 [Neofusicoccum parvum]|nr:hypothetical protein GTA08_BOTSDO05820 [Neofusicoccum parvum]